MASDPQLAFVVLIGTNNLGRGHTLRGGGRPAHFLFRPRAFFSSYRPHARRDGRGRGRRRGHPPQPNTGQGAAERAAAARRRKQAQEGGASRWQRCRRKPGPLLLPVDHQGQRWPSIVGGGGHLPPRRDARYFFFRTIALLHCRRTRLAASGRAASFFFRPPFRPAAGGRVSGRGRAISFFDFFSPTLSWCLQADAARRVGFVDCGGPFRRGEHDVQRELMPDSLRPSLDVEPRWQGREGEGRDTSPRTRGGGAGGRGGASLATPRLLDGGRRNACTA